MENISRLSGRDEKNINDFSFVVAWSLSFVGEPSGLAMDENTIYASFCKSEGYGSKTSCIMSFGRNSGKCLYVIPIGNNICQILTVDERYIFAVMLDGIHVYDKKIGNSKATIPKNGIQDLIIEDGQLIAACSDGIFEWDKDTLQLKSHLNIPNLGCIAVDRNYFYGSPWDKKHQLSIWDKNSGALRKLIEKGCQFNKMWGSGSGIWVDDNRIYSLLDTKINIYDKNQLEKPIEVLAPYSSLATCSFSSIAGDNKNIYICGTAGTFYREKDHLDTGSTLINVGFVGNLKVDQRGLSFYTVSPSENIYIFKKNYPVLANRVLIPGEDLKLIRINKNSIYVASEGCISVIDKKTLKINYQLSAHAKGINILLVDDANIYSASKDKTIRIMDNGTGVIKAQIKLNKEINDVILDEQNIFTASDEKDIKIWESATGRLKNSLSGHAKRVQKLIIGGKYLYSGSDDKTIRKWDKETGEIQKVLEGHTKGIIQLAIKDDLLFSASEDDSIRIWDVNTGQCIKLLEKFPEKLQALKVGAEKLFIYCKKGQTLSWVIKEQKKDPDDRIGFSGIQYDGHGEQIGEVRYIPDINEIDNQYHYMITGGILQIWDTKSHNQVAKFGIPDADVNNKIKGLAFDEKYLYFLLHNVLHVIDKESLFQ